MNVDSIHTRDTYMMIMLTIYNHIHVFNIGTYESENFEGRVSKGRLSPRPVLTAPAFFRDRGADSGCEMVGFDRS